MSLPILPLTNMDERHTGLPHHTAGHYLDAAKVCLDRHHSSPVEFNLQDDSNESKTQVEWTCADERCRQGHANEIDATEAGAYAFALAATELSKGLIAVRRAETNTGADYYIGPANEDIEDLENCWRLEVSGTNKGSVADVKRVLKEKVEQAVRGNSNLPALAAVIGFQAKLIMLRTAEETL